MLTEDSSIEIISSNLYFLITSKKSFNSCFSFLICPLYVFGKCEKVALLRVILLSLIISDKYCLDIFNVGYLLIIN